MALKNYPAINAEIEGNEIIYKNYYNIGIAVGTDRGLVVPVLKKSDELSFADLERIIFLLSEKAKNGKIVIAAIDGQLTVKRLKKSSQGTYLMPENDEYEPIKIEENNDVVICGVVTNVLHEV